MPRRAHSSPPTSRTRRAPCATWWPRFDALERARPVPSGDARVPGCPSCWRLCCSPSRPPRAPRPRWSAWRCAVACPGAARRSTRRTPPPQRNGPRAGAPRRGRAPPIPADAPPVGGGGRGPGAARPGRPRGRDLESGAGGTDPALARAAGADGATRSQRPAAPRRGARSERLVTAALMLVLALQGPPPDVTAQADHSRLAAGEEVLLTVRPRPRAAAPLPAVLAALPRAAP